MPLSPPNIPLEISLTVAAIGFVLLFIIVLRGPVKPRNRRRYWWERLIAQARHPRCLSEEKEPFKPQIQWMRPRNYHPKEDKQ